VNSGLAMDVTGQSTSDGAAVDQWRYWSGDNQKWNLTNVGGSLRDHQYREWPTGGSARILACKRHAARSVAIQWRCKSAMELWDSMIACIAIPLADAVAPSGELEGSVK